jgi:hypothetical protein
LAGLVSKPSEDPVTVLEIEDALPLSMVSVNCDVAPLPSDVKLQLTVPLLPKGGAPQPVGAVPLSFVIETKVVPPSTER